jgi:indole-3-glycerol phosphate synthase
MSVLQEICDKKRIHVAAQKAKTSLEELKARIATAPAPNGFISALQKASGPALIAEVKKASPSKGIIRQNFNPVEIALAYQRGGASCLSVLTDEPYFQGSDEIFATVRNAVNMPMLRKDFMVEPYQIYESRAMGADCILIIMAALDDSLAKELYDLSESLGMDALIEVHNEGELKRASRLNPKMIGVNNRNLKTLNVDIQTSFDLLKLIPSNVVKVAESGIADADTIQSLYSQGYKGFLVGESLMRQENIEAATTALLTQKAN